jgi:hypothetical protein
MLTEKKTKEIFVKTKALLQGHFIIGLEKRAISAMCKIINASKTIGAYL